MLTLHKWTALTQSPLLCCPLAGFSFLALVFYYRSGPVWMTLLWAVFLCLLYSYEETVPEDTEAKEDDETEKKDQ